jgi:hypothetical protein
MVEKGLLRWLFFPFNPAVYIRSMAGAQGSDEGSRQTSSQSDAISL